MPTERSASSWQSAARSITRLMSSPPVLSSRWVKADLRLFVRFHPLYPQGGDNLWITVDRSKISVGNLLKGKKGREMAKLAHSSTHTFYPLTHILTQLNNGSDLLFPYLSTVFTSSYYYYLYIYKSRFQADRFHIRFPLLQNTYMDLRATA